MKTIYTYLLISILTQLSFQSFAQEVDIEWEYALDTEKDTYSKAIINTRDGGFLVGGTEITEVNLNPNIYVYYENYQLVKLDKDGEEEWSKIFGGETYDYLESIIQTEDGGFLVGGNSETYISGNKTVDTYGVADFWILKLDNNGNIEWQETYGGISQEIFAGFVEIDDGYMLAGSSFSHDNGIKKAPKIGKLDYWLIKINKKGELIWDKTYGGIDNDVMSSISVTSEGDFILAGTSGSNSSEYKSEDNRGRFDYWIVKVNSDGDMIWDKTLGGTLDDDLINAFVTDDEYLIVQGESYSSYSGDKTTVVYKEEGSSDLWIVKLDLDGNEIWQKSLVKPQSLMNPIANSEIAYLSYESFYNEEELDIDFFHFPYYIRILDGNGDFKKEIYIEEFNKYNYYTLNQTPDKSFVLSGYQQKGDYSDLSDYKIITNLNVLKIFDDVNTDNLKNNLKLFPNPFADNLKIDYDKDVTVKMYNSIGKKIIETDSKSFSVNHLSQGVYYLRIYNVKGDLISINKVLKYIEP